jgi:putative tryptophan/tyrosine transport system substrate-binding protein
MRRREFIALFGTVAVLPIAWPGGSRAQQVVKPARIGLLAFGQDITSPSFDAFRNEMHRLGQVEGQTYVLEFRSAHGDPDSLRNIAAELGCILINGRQII